jgi:hypothetical protein
MSTFTLPIGVYLICYNIFGSITANGLVVTGILKYNGVVINQTAAYGINVFNFSIGASYVLQVTSASQSITLEAWGSGAGTLTIATPSTPSAYVQYTRIA